MNRVLYNPLTALILTVVVIIFILSLHKTGQKNEQVAKTAQVINLQVETLKQQVSQAEQRLSPSQDKEDLLKEQVFRDELLMQKEGEVVIQLPPLSASPLDEAPSLSSYQSVWEEWREILFTR
jgi:cell division protein FtsB